MIVNLLYLLPAAALLWIPRQMLRFKRSAADHPKYTNPRSMREPGDTAFRPGEEFAKVRNYVDLFRGMAGSYGIMIFGLSVDSRSTVEARATVLVIQALILVVAVLIQTIRWDGRLALQAPAFFLAGTASGICGIECAIYGTAAAWVVNAILPTPSAFLLAQGILIGAFGAFFHMPTDRMVVMAGLLTIMPSIIGFMLRRPLAIGTRHPSKDN